MENIKQRIIDAFEQRDQINARTENDDLREAVRYVIDEIDRGELRIAEKISGEWVVHQWLKKAVLLSFRLNDNDLIEGGETRFWDKVPAKFADYDSARFRAEGMRVVPPAMVRKGALSAVTLS
jgi:2,3,4,5-tetrahydropyridine-2,6-dicarboxylate N-succinyltransferase (EC 2.3.1.117)